ncbi:NGO_0222 family membrane protein [Neisseria perflava]|uniref:NGO_0222 family membrane protein n=1 Tax=Neisseria perflava TaxID=33053 RepID=UPI0020A1FE83|nr:NGO_0222 family membrane protein [Neisseria perflava]MCP1660364.1 cell shape-determining protein MreC [Neisseria perflava]
MNTRKTYLLLIVFFTLLFMALVLLGSYLLSVDSKQYAVAAFLFAFAAIFGQIASLALYIRHKAKLQLYRQQQGKQNV